MTRLRELEAVRDKALRFRTITATPSPLQLGIPVNDRDRDMEVKPCLRSNNNKPFLRQESVPHNHFRIKAVNTIRRYKDPNLLHNNHPSTVPIRRCDLFTTRHNTSTTSFVNLLCGLGDVLDHSIHTTILRRAHVHRTLPVLVE